MSDKQQSGASTGDLRKVFIATTAETWDADWFTDALASAEANIRKSQPDVELMPWPSVFKTGDITAPRLVALASEIVGAIVVFTADDYTKSRGKAQSAPRDNLVLEAGIFLSRLGMAHVLLLREKSSKWPSDLLGVTTKEFSRPPANQQGPATILASDIARSMRRFVDDLPRPQVASAAHALSQSGMRMLKQAEDLKRRLESPPTESPISIPDPLYVYLDALERVETGFATTTYLESGFWTSRDLKIIAANKRMLERITQAKGTARRLILLSQSVDDELRMQRMRRRLLRSGDLKGIQRMNKEYRDFASANLDLISQGFNVKVVFDRNNLYQSLLPDTLARSNDTELALYDTARLDRFSGFTSKERARVVDVYDANQFLEFDALRSQVNAYFEALWEDRDAEEFSLFASKMDSLIDEVDREIDYTPNWLALYDRSDGDDGALKDDEARLVRKWLEKRHGQVAGIVASHIDLGTCTGRYLKELRECVVKDGVIVGIDIDPDCVQLVKLKQARDELGESEVKEGDIRRRDDLPSRTFDMVTCMMGTLCHLERSAHNGGLFEDELQVGLQNIGQLLADDGDAFLAVWDANAFKRSDVVLKIYDQRSRAILHGQSPTRQELMARATQAGLGIVQDQLVQSRLRVVHLHRVKS